MIDHIANGVTFLLGAFLIGTLITAIGLAVGKAWRWIAGEGNHDD